MKRTLFFIVILLCCQAASAYDFSAVAPSGQRLYYNIVNGHVEVVRPGVGASYNGYVSGNLTIPDTVTCNGTTYTVTALAAISTGQYTYGPFSGCNGLTTVTIPSSINSICLNAFNYSVTSVYYTGTIAQWCNIDNDGIFSYSYSLYINGSPVTNLVIPTGVTEIKRHAFYGCDNLTHVTIPSSISSIGEDAFYGCSNLTNVNYNGTIAQWCNIDFYNVWATPTSCSHSLEINDTLVTNNLIIPDGISEIKQYTFSGCNVTSVTIPSSVTFIGEGAFKNCIGLNSVVFNANNCSSGGAPFSGCSNITSFIFGDDIKVIPTELCSGLSNLASVIIPDSVTTIGNFAFYNCTNLASVEFNAVHCVYSGSPYDYDSRPFRNCSNITNFTFGNAVEVVPANLCYKMSNLTSVTIPNTVTSIGVCAFSKCIGLTTITIPNSVTSIGASAFYYCTGLTTVTIGKNVAQIGYYSFYDCSNLDTVYMLPNTPPTIDYSSFNHYGASPVFILTGCSYNLYYTTNTNSNWYQYRNKLVKPIINIDVTALSSDITQGSANVVIGPDNHVVRCDSTVVIRATANYGYHFDHWSNDRTANPDTIALVGDSTVIAYFAPNNYAITGVSSNNVRGTVTGSDTVEYLDTVTLIAHPNYGYHFDHWTYTNEENNNTSIQQGGDTLILVATRNRTASAYFAPNQYLLTVNVDNPSCGDVSGGGMCDYLSMRTIVATAKSGYHFDHWSTGSTDNPFTLTITSDTTVIAYFISNQGIGEIGENDIHIHVSDGRICVEGITNEEVRVYDITGRMVQNHSLPSGVYIVKVGTLPAQKVVVMRQHNRKNSNTQAKGDRNRTPLFVQAGMS